MIVECKICEGNSYLGMTCKAVTPPESTASSRYNLMIPPRREAYRKDGVVTRVPTSISRCPAFMAAMEHDRGSGKFERFLVRDERHSNE